MAQRPSRQWLGHSYSVSSASGPSAHNRVAPSGLSPGGPSPVHAWCLVAVLEEHFSFATFFGLGRFLSPLGGIPSGERLDRGRTVANRNDAVVEILKLGFEFENSVARPEDFDDPSAWFVSHIYVPSLLDEVLLEEIKSDRWDVVFITGNPGDGKSAFMGRVAALEATDGGRAIHLKHDATEPTDLSNRASVAEADLKTFLEPLSDSAKELSDGVFVVGINKGMLQRAILAERSGFRERLVPSLLGEGRSFRAVLVDLNERTFADVPFERNDDLFDRVLGRLVAPALWEERGCADCEDRDWCPFFANTKRFREPLPANRLKTLWAVQELRGNRHATMRDLLATIGYVLVGHEDMFHAGDDPDGRLLHPCEFVEREKANGEPLGLFRRMQYNSAFRDDDIYAEPGERATVLLEMDVPTTALTYGFAPEPWRDLAASDPGRGSWNEDWESIERRVITRPDKFLERLSRSDSQLESVIANRLTSFLEEIRNELLELEPSAPRYKEALEDYRQVLFFLVALSKRWSFFFEAELAIDSLTDYRYLSRYVACLRFLRGEDNAGLDISDDVAKSTIPIGLIEAEGLHTAETYPSDLFVRWAVGSSNASASLTLRLEPVLSVRPKTSDYVEGGPNVLLYRPLGETSEAELVLRLDDFELVHRLAQGFRDRYGHLPRTPHVRNFRERLRAERAQRLSVRDRLNPERRLQVEADGRVIFR